MRVRYILLLAWVDFTSARNCILPSTDLTRHYGDFSDAESVAIHQVAHVATSRPAGEGNA